MGREINFENMPLSEIVESNEGVKVKANKLFNKYIDNDAEFVINISGKMRDELTDSIGDLDELQANELMDMNAMLTIFDTCYDEMISLQSISFERFKQSKTFDAVKALFNKHKRTRGSFAG